MRWFEVDPGLTLKDRPKNVIPYCGYPHCKNMFYVNIKANSINASVNTKGTRNDCKIINLERKIVFNRVIDQPIRKI